MKTTIHMGQSVRDALWRQEFGIYETDDGKPLSRGEAFKMLCDALASGKEFIPLGPCDKFDPKSGCKGHPVWEWPELGEGQEWSNPSNLTVEEVGEGYRPFIKGERVRAGDQFHGKTLTEFWHDSDKDFGDTPDEDITYRTKRPLPAVPKRVPLEMNDIPAVCWVAYGISDSKNPKMISHRLVLHIDAFGIKTQHDEIDYKRLAQGWEYSTDRVTWLPCSKEVQP